MSSSFHLYQLQKIDTQLDQISQRSNEIQRLLEEDTNLRAAKQQLEAAEKQARIARQALHQVEASVQAKRVKKEQSEASLYGGLIKNPKELQDLQNEVASLKRVITKLEDEELEAMIAVEEAEDALKTAQQQMAQAQAEFTQQNASLTGEQSQLTRTAERLHAERELVTSQISVDSISSYDRLRKAKRGVAVAFVDEDSCGTCGAALTPAERQSARSPHQIVLCPSCGRILYAG